MKERRLLMKMCLVTLVACNAAYIAGCSQLQVITEQNKVNCLDFATSYAEIDNGQVIFGLYLPNQSTYHAWVKRRDGKCMDQMGQFDCDDSRYKALSVPSVGEIVKLMGDRV